MNLYVLIIAEDDDNQYITSTLRRDLALEQAIQSPWFGYVQRWNQCLYVWHQPGRSETRSADCQRWK